ncbi:hypothetical protein GCM10009101_15390 [Brevundimonas lenta]
MIVAAALLLLLANCERAVDLVPWKGQPGSTQPNAVGLVTLPCDASTPLEPTRPYYCRRDRHFVTPPAREALVTAAKAMRARYPGEVLRFMDASGPDGEKPFPPHLSHGDGRQIDLGLYYTDVKGRPLDHFPATDRYGGYWPAEPPRPGEEIACPNGRPARAEKPDPPANRPWRLDEARTKALIQALIADRRVRRILIEPHLERRLGLWGHPKLRFAGCQAARHDDHIHVDFH